MNLPNKLTTLRVVLAFFFMVSLLVDFPFSKSLALFFFSLASFTDMYDGVLARKMKLESDYGKLLDPVADKLLLVSCFAALAFIRSPSFVVPAWFVFLVLFRELFIMLGSFLILLADFKFEIAPTIWGKLTTFFQILFIFWIFICGFFQWNPEKTYHVFLALLTVFSVLSLLQYIKIGLNYLYNLSK